MSSGITTFFEDATHDKPSFSTKGFLILEKLGLLVTNPKVHGPYSTNSDYVIKEDLHCIICNKLECPYNHKCMTQLPVKDVLRKVENFESKYFWSMNK